MIEGDRSHHAFAIVRNRYRDSVALLRLSAEVGARAGLESATVVMATPANLQSALEQGFDFDFVGSSRPNPNDIFLGVIGAIEACTAALNWAHQQLTTSGSSATGAPGVPAGAPEPARSLRSLAFRNSLDDSATKIAMISVPGRFAAAETRKALQLGMHAMVFSDNVPLEDEVELKNFAETRDLLVMGPDCGTAVINGVPLGFVNAVRRGPVGVVGASGTGMQEVMARVHQQGSGISQAIGCGGRDLTEEVGGATMRTALRFLLTDANTQAVILVAKPAHPSVITGIVDACQRFLDRGTPVVLAFTGADNESVIDEPRIRVARSLAGAADLVVSLLSAARSGPEVSLPDHQFVDFEVAEIAAERRRIVGAFVGGTLCAEYKWLVGASAAKTDLRCTDFGDDTYTNGRPHPMIDPRLRDAAVANALNDPTVALVHFDIVLGFGSADDPLSGLEPALSRHQSNTNNKSFITAHVLGTDLDHQGKAVIVSRLERLGVLTYDTNAEAASIGIAIASRIANGDA
jgi:FdrA protein